MYYVVYMHALAFDRVCVCVCLHHAEHVYVHELKAVQWIEGLRTWGLAKNLLVNSDMKWLQPAPCGRLWLEAARGLNSVIASFS